MGLSEATLRDIVARGLAARNQCNPFHPPSYPGTAQWAETHVALRETLTRGGWRADDTGNFSTVVSPDGRIAITIAAGTDRTGKPGLPAPQTRYKRGPMTHRAVRHNRQLELNLFPTSNSTEAGDPSLERPAQTWILLIATRHDGLRAELSRPSDFDEGGRVVAWSERILLESLEVEPNIGLDLDDDHDDSIDVPVERL